MEIHTGKGINTQTDRYWGRSWYVWNNDGDQATLKDGSGTVIDTCAYSDGDTILDPPASEIMPARSNSVGGVLEMYFDC